MTVKDSLVIEGEGPLVARLALALWVTVLRRPVEAGAAGALDQAGLVNRATLPESAAVCRTRLEFN